MDVNHTPSPVHNIVDKEASSEKLVSNETVSNLKVSESNPKNIKAGLAQDIRTHDWSGSRYKNTCFCFKRCSEGFG